ncbi:MAG: hypothetical protein ACRC7R_07840 [Sarcina sp.]
MNMNLNELATINCDLSKSTLSGGAIVNTSTNFIDNIGGIVSGSCKTVVTVPNDGVYELVLDYLSSYSDSYLSVDVNGVESSDIYFLPMTKGDTVDYMQQFNLNVDLKAGENTLLFRGDGINNGPSIGKFTLSEITRSIDVPLIPTPIYSVPITNVVSYDPVLGRLSNGAVINNKTNLIDNIGGVYDGNVELVVTVAMEGLYELALNYLSPYAESVLKININGVDLENAYFIQGTMGDTVEYIQQFYAKINLKSGQNTISFHGDGINNGPSIGIFTVNLLEMVAPPIYSTAPTTQVKYNTAFGTLSNGAIVNETTNFVDNIGGPLDGASEIMVDVMDEGEYSLVMKYLAPNGDVILMIDINGANTRVPYTLLGTKSDDVSAAEFSVMITLKAGSNKIKFHGDGVNKGPSIGEFTFNKVVNLATGVNKASMDYKINTGILSNGASINGENGFVEKLGGPLDGTAQLSIVVDNGGEYDLAITYLTITSDTTLKVTVNNMFNSAAYSIPPTNSYNVSDVLIYHIKVILNAGVNLISFHGDGVKQTPSIESVKINYISAIRPPVLSTPDSSSTVENYDTVVGALSNGATVNMVTNFVNNIGGTLDGAVEVLVNVKNGGKHELNLSYLCPYDNSGLKLSVNGVDSEDVYFLPKTMGGNAEDAKIFSYVINLNTGSNTIKFHGDKLRDSISTGRFTLKNIEGIIAPPVLSTPEIANITSYEPAFGMIKNGASINDITNFVDDIGGTNDGSVEILVNVENEGHYKLEFIYVSPNDNTTVKIDINGVDTGEEYFIPQTIGSGVEHAAVFSYMFNLTEGGNKIKFYGNGINSAFSIGRITINSDIISLPPILSTTIVGVKGISLTGSAKVENSFITGISGVNQGVVAMTFSVPYTGVYDLAISYVADDTTKKIQLDVNGDYAGMIQGFDKTLSMNKDHVQVKVIPLTLEQGINQIRVY